MRRFILQIIALTLAMLAAGELIEGIVFADIKSALIAALLLALLNAFIRPLLVILTLPITVLTLGLFLLVINALLLIAVSWLVDGFFVVGFWNAFVGSIIISIVNGLILWLTKDRKKD